MKHLRIILYLLATALCLSAQGQSLSAQKDKKARLERDIKVLEEQLSANARKSSNAATRLNLLRTQVSARRELVKESEAELAVIGDSLARLSRSIDSLSRKLDTLTHYYNKLVLNAYRNRDSRIWYMYILSSSNLAQASRRYSYLRSLSTQMNTQGRLIKDARSQLEAQQQHFAGLKSKNEKLRSARAAELDKLQRAETESQQLIQQLQKDKKTYQKQLEAKRRQVESLNREIEKLIAAAMGNDGSGAKKGKNSASQKKPIDYTLSKNFAGNKGKLPWPAEGRVTEHFGRHNHPVYTNLVMPFNNGINIALHKDAAVKVVFDGVVKQVIVMPGYNQCVLVQHGEYFTFYCKLGSVAVKAGDKVSTGQVIGHVVTIADETQLHFQLWKEKTPQDPEDWLRKL